MYNIAIITPIILNSPEIADIYISNLRTYTSLLANLDVYLICNKFNANLLNKVCEASTLKLVVNDKERSVAGAWNYGFKIASETANYEFYYILACDIALHPDCIDSMIKFGQENKHIDLWSSTDIHSGKAASDAIDACDFSSVMFRRDAIEKFGWFDREYKPAYFEDNDYAERVKRMGGVLRAVCYATHYHYGSLTINADAEARHHVDHWFEKNKQRFIEKFNRESPDWKKTAEENRHGYEPWGGIHD